MVTLGLMPALAHPLDRPVWSALTGGWSPLAEASGAALRLPRDYGPFAATPGLDAGSLAGLAGFEPGEDGLWLVEAGAVEAPPGLAAVHHARCVQMTTDDVAPADPEFDVLPLGETDAGEMLALARLTRPGPFASRTHRLGGFIGVRREGRLAAMAGERMKLDGFTEVSGVCTHPDHRGRGYASALMRLAARRILERGETPFLHVYEANAAAIALYETLGFRIRRKVVLTVLNRA
jgi:ribosomal protein S18 acetylase RimI-like enzyme